MTTEENLNDILSVDEQPDPDHRAHAKQPKHVDDDELEARTEHERQAVQSEDSGSA